ncbi:hypothetical protein L2E82_14720 [Cichorium intybus]|uniref:Uncharacterized protein n=1 Tax=Cichorium intybus TaxID=13427 RepID=A0ACB9F0U5_CICIN|nr:hypothetical protein L2E82_14720 [Cichorium intybus]
MRETTEKRWSCDLSSTIGNFYQDLKIEESMKKRKKKTMKMVDAISTPSRNIGRLKNNSGCSLRAVNINVLCYSLFWVFKKLSYWVSLVFTYCAMFNWIVNSIP